MGIMVLHMIQNLENMYRIKTMKTISDKTKKLRTYKSCENEMALVKDTVVYFIILWKRLYNKSCRLHIEYYVTYNAA